MLDPIHIPILLKAIDFIFDEGRKILDERREQRKQGPATPVGAPAVPAAEITPAENAPASEKKQDLLNSKIDQILWQNHEQEVQHLVRLLETHSRNYHIASEQYARWGSALVPPIVVHNMTEAENAMAATLGKLEDVLSKVYEKDITPNP